MTPVKSAQQQETVQIEKINFKEAKGKENLLWRPNEEQKGKSKMSEFLRHVNKQYNLSKNNTLNI